MENVIDKMVLTEQKERKKTTNKTPNKTPNKTTNRDESNNRLKQVVEEQAGIIASMKEQIEMLTKLVANNVANTEVIKPQKEDMTYVTVGCRAFSGAALANKDESVCVIFACGEEKEILLDDLKEILRDSGLRKNKAYFERGIFYFKDEAYYEQFKIKKVIDLSWEAIKKIVLMPDITAIIRKLQELTNNRTDIAVMHTLQYTITQMIVDKTNPLMGMSYQTRIALEDFFGNKFDLLANYAGIINILRK